VPQGTSTKRRGAQSHIRCIATCSPPHSPDLNRPHHCRSHAINQSAHQRKSGIRTACKLLDHHISSKQNHAKSCVVHCSCSAQPDCHQPPRSVARAPPRASLSSIAMHLSLYAEPAAHQARSLTRSGSQAPRAACSGAHLRKLLGPSLVANITLAWPRTPALHAPGLGRPCCRSTGHASPRRRTPRRTNLRRARPETTALAAAQWTTQTVAPARPGTCPELGSRARLTRSRRGRRRPPLRRAQTARPAPGAGRAAQTLWQPQTL